jgi:thymidylate synthase ThyX
MSKVFIYDEFNPQDIAMMQALYSRSADSVEEHVKKVRATGSGKFMEKFYVGYGHASIADCGSTTIFLEGVSMLAAKAVEDWPLFSGQETSSRYIDYSKQPIIDPVKTKASKAILEKWMKFYIESQPTMVKHLMAKYPRKSDEDEGVYERAINARMFDSLRGFLPAGITTQHSWHTNLRQAHDKLVLLCHYPLKEIREEAERMLTELKKKYPQSFSHLVDREQEKYREYLMSKYNFYSEKKYSGDFTGRTNIKREELKKYLPVLTKRPEKIGLPHFLTELGNVTFEFLLDFGSFRDVQRHRNGVCRMPLLTAKYGFNQWYLEQLPVDLRQKAEKLIKEQVGAIKKLKASLEDSQYYLAMGFNVTCKVSYGLPAAVYVIELRTGKMVHPTLRKVAHQMADKMKKMLPEVLIHADYSPNDWDVRRGLQTVLEKNKK